MDQILTVTMNPALDCETSVPMVRSGSKLRCSAPMLNPGGGGINVSRVIRRLGGQSRAFVALGGAIGEEVLALLQAEGVDAEVLALQGATRISFSVTETSGAGQFRFVLPGPALSVGETEDALIRIASLGAGGIVVVSGSQPPGVPVDFLARLSDRLIQTGSRLFADTSGPALDALLSDVGQPLALLRLDMTEAQQAAGRVLYDIGDSVDFGRDLVDRGVAEIVVISRGAEGSVLVDRHQRLFCRAPSVPVKSKTGAGDSLMAALTWHLSRGDGAETALQAGVAAASAAVMTEATNLCYREDVVRLMPDCRVGAV